MAVRNGMPDVVLGDLYPFEDRYLELHDGVNMHYIEMGRGGRRPTFLLLHGNPTWSFLYRDFMKPLSRIGRVIAVDHVGFGRSDHPLDLGYHTLDRHIRNLEEFCAAKRLKRIIPVVQDWGGPIGLGYATRHPDKLAGLVVLNTWAFTEEVPMKVPSWFRAMRAMGPYLFMKRNLFVEKFIPRFTEKDLGPEVMAGYRHPFPNPESRAAILASTRMIPDRPSHADWPTMDAIEKGLADLDVPARILWAAKDPAFGRRHAKAFHRLLPNASEPEYFQDASHFLQEDIPERLVRHIVDFAKQL